MSLQAGVTADGGEMSRAQILQAQACRLAPHVDMNPVLLKPTTDRQAEVVVLGHARGRAAARDYFTGTNELGAVAEAALDRLRSRHRTIVLEGGLARRAQPDARRLREPAPRAPGRCGHRARGRHRSGGVFAQVKGTLELLPAEDRARVLGVVVNRFRGDPSLFDDGIVALETLAGCPVLAVVPWLGHGLDEEDRPLSLPIDAAPVPGALNVAVVLHPRVANTDDVAPLLAEPDVAATWVTTAGGLAGRDLVILPGSKATVADLQHHVASGMAEAVRDAAASGAFVLGLCGGYQMLGGGSSIPTAPTVRRANGRASTSCRSRRRSVPTSTSWRPASPAPGRCRGRRCRDTDPPRPHRGLGGAAGRRGGRRRRLVVGDRERVLGYAICTACCRPTAGGATSSTSSAPRAACHPPERRTRSARAAHRPLEPTCRGGVPRRRLGAAAR